MTKEELILCIKGVLVLIIIPPIFLFVCYILPAFYLGLIIKLFI